MSSIFISFSLYFHILTFQLENHVKLLNFETHQTAQKTYNKLFFILMVSSCYHKNY